MNRKRRKRWATEEKLTTSITKKGCHFLLWTRNSLIKISFSSQTLQLTSSLNESKQIPPSNSNDLAKWSLHPPPPPRPPLQAIQMIWQSGHCTSLQAIQMICQSGHCTFYLNKNMSNRLAIPFFGKNQIILTEAHCFYFYGEF